MFRYNPEYFSDPDFIGKMLKPSYCSATNVCDWPIITNGNLFDQGIPVLRFDWPVRNYRAVEGFVIVLFLLLFTSVKFLLDQDMLSSISTILV